MNPFVHRYRESRYQKGSALLLVIWCLLILGIVLLGVADLVQQGSQSVVLDEQSLEARCLAQDGIVIGLQPRLGRENWSIVREVTPGNHLEIQVSSEGSRLNLNYLVTSGHREVLVRLFQGWGLSTSDADQLSSSLAAHVGSGPASVPSGAVSQPWPALQLTQHTDRLPFTTLHQVGLVIGMEQVMRLNPHWQDSFTLWSEGPLNINEAPSELIAAVMNLSVAQAQSLVTDRASAPLDDQTLRSVLGLSDQALDQLGSLICYKDSVRRVESIARVQHQTFSITAVAAMDKSPQPYYLWAEK